MRFCEPGGLDVQIDVPTFGPVTVDIAYGGMWYCIVDAAAMGLSLEPAAGKDICRLGTITDCNNSSRHYTGSS